MIPARDISTNLEKAESIISDLFENGGGAGGMDDKLHEARILLCDAQQELNKNETRDISEILCHTLDIAMQLKIAIDIYHNSLSQEQTETTEFVMSSLFSRLAHELLQEVKAASNIC